MPVVKRLIYDSGTKAMAASPSQLDLITMPDHGDLKAVSLQVTQDTAGTLSANAKLVRAIEGLRITDKGGNPITQNIRGIDLRELMFFGNGGRDISEQDTNNSTRTDLYYIPIRVDSSVYPVKVQFELAAYSSMATGATSGNARFVLNGWYADDPNDKRTERIWRIQKSGAVGTNRYAPDLPRGKQVTATYFQITTEGNLTNVTFTRDGSVEIKEVTVNDFKAINNAVLLDQHKTGFFNLFHTPYQINENTELTFEHSGTDTDQIFLRLLD